MSAPAGNHRIKVKKANERRIVKPQRKNTVIIETRKTNLPPPAAQNLDPAKSWGVQKVEAATKTTKGGGKGVGQKHSPPGAKLKQFCHRRKVADLDAQMKARWGKSIWGKKKKKKMPQSQGVIIESA